MKTAHKHLLSVAALILFALAALGSAAS